MKIDSKFKRFFAIILILAPIWAIFSIFSFIYFPSKAPNLAHIPSNANYTLVVQLDELIKQGIYDGIIRNEDEAFFTLLNQKRNNQRSSSKNNGINFFSPIAVVGLTIEGENYQSYFVNLSNKTDFERNFMAQLPTNFIVVFDAEKAILLDTKMELPKSDYLRFQQQLHSYLTKQTNRTLATSSSVFSFHQAQTSHTEAVTIHGNLSGNTLEFHGKVSVNHHNSTIQTQLKQDGFHLSTNYIPTNLKDTIQQLLQANNIKLPNFSTIVINYRGIEVSKGNYFPQMELLLTVDANTNLSDLMEQEKMAAFKHSFVKVNDNAYYLTIGSKRLILKKLDATHLFIGEKEANIVQGSSKHLMEISGDLKNITAIKNGGFLAMGLQMYPPVRIFNESIHNIEKLEVTVSNNGTLKAELKYKNDVAAIAELTKLLFTLQSEFGQ